MPQKVLQLFEEVQQRGLMPDGSYTAVIGLGRITLAAFDVTRLLGLHTDVITYRAVIRACCARCQRGTES